MTQITSAPAVLAVVEAAVYADDLVAAERFYEGILGLPVAGREGGHHLFFRVGDSGMFLVFNSAATRDSGELPQHGTTGPGHFALGVKADDLDRWRRHLIGSGVAIEKELTWPRGGRSIYFRDPAGNLVELITPGVWGTPAGW
jgi:catechol 2,3-dioxygenase-like lactoylglutathione lyase family enzyme